MALLKEADKRRHIGAHAMNERSSRSHFVFQLVRAAQYHGLHKVPLSTLQYHSVPQVTETRVEDSQDGAAVMLGTLTLVGLSTSAHDRSLQLVHNLSTSARD